MLTSFWRDQGKPRKSLSVISADKIRKHTSPVLIKPLCSRSESTAFPFEEGVSGSDLTTCHVIIVHKFIISGNTEGKLEGEISLSNGM